MEDGGGVSVTCCLRCCRQVDNCREADSWITWQLCHDMCHRDTSRVTRPLVTTDKWGGCVTSHNVLQVLTSRLLSRVGCLCVGANQNKLEISDNVAAQCAMYLLSAYQRWSAWQMSALSRWHVTCRDVAIFSRQTAWQQPPPLIYISKLNWSDIKTLLPATFFLAAAVATFSLDIKQCDFSFMTLFNIHLNILNPLVSHRYCCIAVKLKIKTVMCSMF